MPVVLTVTGPLDARPHGSRSWTPSRLICDRAFLYAFERRLPDSVAAIKKAKLPCDGSSLSALPRVPCHAE
jgi:hypothetical protein